MSFGKMNSFIDIVTTKTIKDPEGFTTTEDEIITSVRAYKENRHSNEKWANMAAFSAATVMFRFRVIPNLKVDTTHFIICDGERHNIVSAEDVRNRGMYVEVFADKIKSSKK